MKLVEQDIEKMEKVGHSDKGDIFHILTKGGLNLIVEKSAGGELTVLGDGPHRSFARNKANSLKKINWNESLYKSEDTSLIKADEHPRDQFGLPIYESNPENHYKQATFHAKKAGEQKQIKGGLNLFNNPVEYHDATMRQMMHTDDAIKHFQMAGLKGPDLQREMEKHMNLHHELKPGEHEPFQSHPLELAWNRKNQGKPSPVGLNPNWAE